MTVIPNPLSPTGYSDSRGQPVSAAPTKVSNPLTPYIPKPSGGNGGGESTSGPQSSLTNPTPSAADLYGNDAQKEAQIKAFQSGGQGALNAEVARVRAEEQFQARQAEAARQATLQAKAQEELKVKQTVEAQRYQATLAAMSPFNRNQYEKAQAIINERAYNNLNEQAQRVQSGEIKSYEAYGINIDKSNAYTIMDSIRGYTVVDRSGRGYSVAHDKIIEQPKISEQIKQQAYAINPEGIPYDTLTGNIIGVESISPNFKESYKQFIYEKNPIFSSIEFIGEKVQGAFGNLEYKYTPRSQSLAATGSVSTAIQFAPYTSPPVGFGIMLVGGVAQFATSGGRAEIANADTISKKSLIVGKAAGGIILGGSGTFAKVNQAFGFPKYDMNFQTKTMSVSPQGDAFLAETNTLTRITKRNLLSEDTYMANILSKARIKPLENDYYSSSGFGVGVLKNLRRNIGISENSIGTLQKGKGFAYAGEEMGKLTPTEFKLVPPKELLSQGVSSISKRFEEGYQGLGTSKVQYKGKEQVYYSMSGTKGALINNEEILSLSRIYPYEKKVFGEFKFSKTGRATSIGITKLKPSEIDISFEPTPSTYSPTNQPQIEITKQTTPLKDLLSSSIRAIEKRAIVTAIQSEPKLNKAIVVSKSVYYSTPAVSAFYGKGTYERTTEVTAFKMPSIAQKSLTLTSTSFTFKPAIEELQLNISNQRQLSSYEQKQETSLTNSFKTTLSERQAQDQLQKQSQLQTQLQKQLQRTETILRPRTATMLRPRTATMLRPRTETILRPWTEIIVRPDHTFGDGIGIAGGFGLGLGKSNRKQVRRIPFFNAYIKRRGTFRPLIFGVTKSKAYRIATRTAFGSLGRTIAIKQTGFKEFGAYDIENVMMPEESVFRSYKIRKGKAVPLPFGMYIKRKGITSRGSVAEIQMAKVMKQQNRMLQI